MDFDETRLYYSHQQLQQNPDSLEDATANDAAIRAAVNGGADTEEDAPVDLQACRRHFREFFRKIALSSCRRRDFEIKTNKQTITNSSSHLSIHAA